MTYISCTIEIKTYINLDNLTFISPTHIRLLGTDKMATNGCKRDYHFAGTDFP